MQRTGAGVQGGVEHHRAISHSKSVIKYCSGRDRWSAPKEREARSLRVGKQNQEYLDWSVVLLHVQVMFGTMR